MLLVARYHGQVTIIVNYVCYGLKFFKYYPI